MVSYVTIMHSVLSSSQKEKQNTCFSFTLVGCLDGSLFAVFMGVGNWRIRRFNQCPGSRGIWFPSVHRYMYESFSSTLLQYHLPSLGFLLSLDTAKDVFQLTSQLARQTSYLVVTGWSAGGCWKKFVRDIKEKDC